VHDEADDVARTGGQGDGRPGRFHVGILSYDCCIGIYADLQEDRRARRL
jgi:hypothetical protein